jgi:hypothetical protein
LDFSFIEFSQATYGNRWDVEADIDSSYTLFEPDIKEVCKNIRECHCLTIFCFEKYKYFGLAE